MISLLLFFIIFSGCNLSNGFENKITECDDGKSKIAINEKEYCVEIAKDTLARAKGLMGREKMPEDEGMLFVFEENQNLSFWMMNTLMPLDLLFFDADKKLVDYKNDFQPCRSLICETYDTKSKAKYVVEVNADQFDVDELAKQLLLDYSE